MGIYSVNKLIKEIRGIASDYRKAAALPVTAETALHDAIMIPWLVPDQDEDNSIDACYDAAGEKQSVIVKGWVLFDGRPGQRIGRPRLDQNGMRPFWYR